MNNIQFKYLFKISKINFRYITKNYINLAFLSSFAIIFIIFSALYLKINSKESYDTVYLNLLAIENTVVYSFFGFFAGFLTIQMFFSKEAKNYQILEKQYGLKVYKSFLIRYLSLMSYVMMVTLLYILLEVMVIYLGLGNGDLAKIIALSKFNLLIFIPVIFGVTFILTILVKNEIGIMLTVIYILFVNIGPLFSAILKSESARKNDILIGEVNFNIKVGKDFFEASQRDELNLYDGKSHLFKLNKEDDKYYYNFLNDSELLTSFRNFSTSNEIKVDFRNVYYTYLSGQTLNREYVGDDVKYILGFNKEYINFFIELQDFLQSRSRYVSFSWEETPFFVKSFPQKLKKFDFNKLIDELKHSNLNTKYPNLIRFVEQYWDFILNYNLNELFSYKLFTEDGGVDSKGDEVWDNFVLTQNEEVNDFYNEYPEFLLLSQVINIGFINSFNLNISKYNISSSKNVDIAFEIDEYKKMLNKNKVNQFLNYFNYNSYLTGQFLSSNKATLALNQLKKTWTYSSVKNFVINEEMLNNQTDLGYDYDFINTSESIFSKSIKEKHTNILIYIYNVNFALMVVLSGLSFWIYVKNSKKDWN
ncbi:hypothetical protein SCHIN_v1c00900 [Spiroplasma chinense]|uniref:Uncharacterized protein n=1 Tax=Spiroplasma chinense TaxID=216932 RepID=A0A5B9Y2M7_9MOLU|nr:hypothetical protein [Spiroplasma chinense]QEH61288.1 hypothetical protein SCHIN_v1c00900 [Spiroplasma chinense]